ncbi:MAG TPA: hypothetical protein PK453_19885 [Leptospiraceae bacterium]|nr:hypothetical protein [Leptospiraceae bacterium]HNF15931.1 hypothetical protein [Leptospiraceae bacterium]HNF22972.1 hypothetical protein [Leptospiraceae bacterium]HNI96735.1 hypothetical protein [Leptospiraceae bacterium]HNM04820.1 hypothetical protein [Leptospiraceae bacterium]
MDDAIIATFSELTLGTCAAQDMAENIDSVKHLFVQGLASAGEIWITESIMSRKGMKEILIGSGYILEKKSVELKGVGQAADVWKAEKIKTASSPYL